MLYSQAYQITHCPRYESPDQDASRIRENLLSQAAGLGLLFSAMRDGQNGQWELRFVADPVQRSVHLFWLMAGELGHSEVTVLPRLLPTDFGWQPVALPANGHWPYVAGTTQTPWHLATIQRRFDFIELPGSWSRLLTSSPSTRERSALTNSPVAFAPRELIESSDLLPREPSRFRKTLPPLWPMEVGQRRRAALQLPLCLPLLESLTEETQDRRRFFQELLRAAPASVSLTLFPVHDAELEQSRTVAGPIHRWLTDRSRELVGSGVSMGEQPLVSQVRNTFDRFQLSTSRLCGMNLQVAAARSDDALSLAHCLCAQWGGTHAFEIRSSTIDSAAMHVPPTRSAPDKSVVRDRLAREEIEVEDDEYFGFLNQLPSVYTAAEAALILRLPVAFREGLPGITTRLVAPFQPINVRLLPCGEPPPPARIRLGRVPAEAASAMRTAANSDWQTLRVADLTKHALIAGSTGSGKSVAAQFLLRELHRLAVPFLIIEPVKTEYHDALRADIPTLKRWRLEGDAQGRLDRDFLIFDPLRLQTGISVSRHVAHLKSCFAAAFPLSDVMALILENGLHAYYTSAILEGGCGFTLFTRGGPGRTQAREDAQQRRGVFPSFHTFTAFFLDRYLDQDLNPNRLREPPEFVWEIREAFRRRFRNLKEGALGAAFQRADEVFLNDHRYWNPFPSFLSRPTIIELDAVADNEHKALVTAFLLTFLVEHRQAEDLSRRAQTTASNHEPPHLKHALLIEEAHRLLAASAESGHQRGETVGAGAQARAVEMFVDLLAEMRAYGQGLVVVEQIPTRLAADVVKNINLKLMFRLATIEERDFLANSMNFRPDQQRFAATLRTGQAIVHEENLEQPLLMTVPAPGSAL